MKIKCILLLAVTILFAACYVKAKQESTQSAPNIVFLFADDMTYSAIHALGNSEISTPNLDRLVNNGTSFSNTFNMGGWNGAICAASRAIIISGRHIWRANEFRQNWIAKDSSAYEKSWGKDTILT